MNTTLEAAQAVTDESIIELVGLAGDGRPWPLRWFEVGDRVRFAGQRQRGTVTAIVERWSERIGCESASGVPHTVAVRWESRRGDFMVSLVADLLVLVERPQGGEES